MRFDEQLEMAARTRRIRHTDDTRNKIRASQLINRLEDHVFGETELTQTQLTAIKILLGKCLPDLQAVELSGQDGGPLRAEVELTFTRPAQ
jgi:hypothetical protein